MGYRQQRTSGGGIDAWVIEWQGRKPARGHTEGMIHLLSREWIETLRSLCLLDATAKLAACSVGWWLMAGAGLF
jgi:hypothetical protein